MNPKLNAMLAQLPEADYELLLPFLQLVSLEEGRTLYALGQPMPTVYFPINTLVAVAMRLRDGVTIDTCLVGAQGIMGLRGLFAPCQHHIYVAVTGMAYKMDIERLRQVMRASFPVLEMCLRARENNLVNMSIEVACSHFHSNEQRLARWLLTRMDRHQTQHFQTTHQAIADSLGVRRETVTHALSKLKGLEYGRGQIKVVDRSGIESACCECYALQR